MNKLGLSLLVLLIVSLLATACGAKETEVPTPVPTRRPTSTAVTTRTPRPTSTATIPPTPTNTPLPTAIPEGGEWELIQVHEEEGELVTIETVNETIEVAWGILKNVETGAEIDGWCMNTTCHAEESMIYGFNGVLFYPCEEEYKQVFSNFSLLLLEE